MAKGDLVASTLASSMRRFELRLKQFDTEFLSVYYNTFSKNLKIRHKYEKMWKVVMQQWQHEWQDNGGD